MNTSSNYENCVRLVDGDKTEVISKIEAINRANLLGMDIVLIDDRANPPVVKIMDEGKYNYELEKKKKRANKQQKQNQSKMKEIQLRPVTGDNDIKTKAKNINEFLDKGHNVKIAVKFKGRENSHIDMGELVINKLLEKLNDFAIVHDTRGSGKEIVIIIEPIKNV